MEIEYKCNECDEPTFIPDMHEVPDCKCGGELKEVEGYTYIPISMTYELHGRCMWHSDCIPGRGNGIMKLYKREAEHDLMKCLHCGKLGYYPVGGLGMIEAEEQS